MLYGLDSATPPSHPETLVAMGYSFVCGYLLALSGQRTPHTWTTTEWALQAAGGLQLMPIAVAPYGTPSYDQGVIAGNDSLEAMHKARLSGILTLDIENGAVPADYTAGFINAVHAGDCSVMIYGSGTTISGLAAAIGWVWDKTWLANWVSSGQMLKPAAPDFDMWQYATGPVFDYDVAVNDFPFATLNQ